ncbi:Hypothetical protein NTJ_14508 [Nesidiocoris tenuis]|uniref:Uncharacterized protein n=1 Tax=Nesidiocoris tenuis TaxID=355587 RepID=A0ABN7BBH4_9HEMI|nr:Hypothetical protein NTJ_14508 [Nesidiocoris tenuis]
MRSIFLVVLLVALTQALEPKDDPVKKLLKAAELSQGQNSLLQLSPKDGNIMVTDSSTCDYLKLSQDGTDFVITTVQMMNEVFKLSYQAVAHKNDCPFTNSFRCFLKQYTDFMSILSKVKAEIVSYSNDSPGFFTDIHNCLSKSSLVNY